MKHLILAIFSLSLFVAACGGGEQQPAQQTTVPTGRVIEIFGIDQMKFAVKSASVNGLEIGDEIPGNSGYYELKGITASPNEEITLKLRTISMLPANAMSHNFVLMAAGADVEAFATGALQAQDTGYITPGYETQILVHTKMLGNSEEDTITFNAPSEAGSYLYICSFPAHYMAGMRGTLTVQ